MSAIILKVSRIGNSRGIRLPAAMLRKYHIGDTIIAEEKVHEIVLRPGTPKEKRLLGQAYLSNYGLPQFFFHVTTAYAILRHHGVEVGKKDYMGAY